MLKWIRVRTHVALVIGGVIVCGGVGSLAAFALSSNVSQRTVSSAPVCTSSQLSASVLGTDFNLKIPRMKSASTTGVIVALTNSSGSDCSITGFPQVSFTDANGSHIDVYQVNGLLWDLNANIKIPATLAPGGISTFSIYFPVNSSRSGPLASECPLASNLLITPTPATNSGSLAPISLNSGTFTKDSIEQLSPCPLNDAVSSIQPGSNVNGTWQSQVSHAAGIASSTTVPQKAIPIPLPPPVNIAPPSAGIFSSSAPLPAMSFQSTNAWQGPIGSTWYVVFAGGARNPNSGSVTKGELFVTGSTLPNPSIEPRYIGRYSPPGDTSPLTIQSVTNSIITCVNTQGTIYKFDLTTMSYQ